MGNTAGAVSILELLLHKTGENGGTIALIYPDESADYIRGFIDGSTDALRLALDHVKDSRIGSGRTPREIKTLSEAYEKEMASNPYQQEIL
jgi:hypothetical protein